MQVSYGPPGTTGVKSLQYLSGDEKELDRKGFATLGLLAAGIWLYATHAKKTRWQQPAFVSAASLFLAQIVGNNHG